MVFIYNKLIYISFLLILLYQKITYNNRTSIRENNLLLSANILKHFVLLSISNNQTQLPKPDCRTAGMN